MRHAIVYGDQRIAYRVERDERRTTRVAIHVDPDGTVVVDAPLGFDEATIQRAVQKRARWVANHVAEARDRYAHVRPREYVSGEQVFYLGKRYVLKVVPVEHKPGPVKLRGNRLVVETRTGDPDDVKGQLRGWYQVKARAYFVTKISDAAQRLPWVEQVPPFRLLVMQRQWGSCSPTGQIILNPHLVKAPRECIEYVIIHELAHLEHRGHGPEFWKLVEKHVPEWQVAKTRLDALVEVMTAE